MCPISVQKMLVSVAAASEDRMEIFWFKKSVTGVRSHMIIDKRREGELVSGGYQSHGLVRRYI